MKKLIAFIILTSLLLGSLPTYAATVGNTITVQQFTSKLLDTMGQSYSDPLEKAVELRIIPSNDPMLSMKSKPVTKEQTAQLIYGALQVRENVQPDLYYERVLKSFISDYSSISDPYRRAVCNTIMKGFYEPTSTSATDKRFVPKKVMTEADVQLLLSRFFDKSLRYDPFQYDNYNQEVDKIKTWRNYSWIISTAINHKVSPYKLKVPFVTGKPSPNRDAVVKSLFEGEFNNYSMAFRPYYKYDDYIKVYSEDITMEAEHWYPVAVDFANKFFNFSYKDMASQAKEIKSLMPCNPTANDIIAYQKQVAEKYKVSMESFFITDKSLFYSGTVYDAIKGKLYFKATGNAKEIPFRIYKQGRANSDTKIKTNTWYVVEYDIEVSHMANYEDYDHQRPWVWIGDPNGVSNIYQTSDVYELSPQ